MVQGSSTLCNLGLAMLQSTSDDELFIYIYIYIYLILSHILERERHISCFFNKALLRHFPKGLAIGEDNGWFLIG